MSKDIGKVEDEGVEEIEEICIISDESHSVLMDMRDSQNPWYVAIADVLFNIAERLEER